MADIKTLLRIDGNAEGAVEALEQVKQAAEGVEGAADKTGQSLADAGEKSQQSGKEMQGVTGAAAQLGATLANQVAPGAAQAGQAIAGLASGGLAPMAAGLMAATAVISLVVKALADMEAAAERARQAQRELGIAAAATAQEYRNQLSARMRLETGLEFTGPEARRETQFYQQAGGLESENEGAAVAIEMRVAARQGRPLSSAETRAFTQGVGLRIYTADEKGMAQFRRDMRRNPQHAEEIESKFGPYTRTPEYALNMLGARGDAADLEEGLTARGQLEARADRLAANDTDARQQYRDDITQAFEGPTGGEYWVEATTAPFRGFLGQTRESRQRDYQDAALKRLRQRGILNEDFAVNMDTPIREIGLSPSGRQTPPPNVFNGPVIINNQRPDRPAHMGRLPEISE